jgi:very-short-patch-repair endonuclease
MGEGVTVQGQKDSSLPRWGRARVGGYQNGDIRKVSKQIERARQLRKNMTDAERFLWNRLRKKKLHGLRFRRQHPIGPYVVDFVCIETRLVIELDGGQHQEQVEKDIIRDKWLVRQGYQVLRFWNNQVFNETEPVLEKISDSLLGSTNNSAGETAS